MQVLTERMALMVQMEQSVRKGLRGPQGLTVLTELSDHKGLKDEKETKGIQAPTDRRDPQGRMVLMERMGRKDLLVQMVLLDLRDHKGLRD
jgi:hypothetical protein